ncbi:MAG: hypothetical protein ACOCTM_00315 [Bacteroidota bacterium]
MVKGHVYRRYVYFQQKTYMFIARYVPPQWKKTVFAGRHVRSLHKMTILYGRQLCYTRKMGIFFSRPPYSPQKETLPGDRNPYSVTFFQFTLFRLISCRAEIPVRANPYKPRQLTNADQTKVQWIFLPLLKKSNAPDYVDFLVGLLKISNILTIFNNIYIHQNQMP